MTSSILQSLYVRDFGMALKALRKSEPVSFVLLLEPCDGVVPLVCDGLQATHW
jgi:hypothetical protein